MWKNPHDQVSYGDYENDVINDPSMYRNVPFLKLERQIKLCVESHALDRPLRRYKALMNF